MKQREMPLSRTHDELDERDDEQRGQPRDRDLCPFRTELGDGENGSGVIGPKRKSMPFSPLPPVVRPSVCLNSPVTCTPPSAPSAFRKHTVFLPPAPVFNWLGL
ncbi:hypothetical protein K0M31_010198 [Melipona bicolor]|uniref:Uncharacterized protein n=1 Tax=Melipona bicolor TaxID=60889 RepID=A0AA40FLN7_9HYME|nr:hypothetical protein K0M31_010198 [Melipona bicolor]